MVSQREYQTLESPAVPRQKGVGLVERVGWGVICIAVGLFGLFALLAVQVPAVASSSRTVVIFMVAFFALMAGGLTILAMSHPIARLLSQRGRARKASAPPLAEPPWEEQREQLAQIRQ